MRDILKVDTSFVTASNLLSRWGVYKNGAITIIVSNQALEFLKFLADYLGKTEEDRQRDIALYKTLLERRNDLEEKLLSKLEELKSVCISEGVCTSFATKKIEKYIKI